MDHVSGTAAPTDDVPRLRGRVLITGGSGFIARALYQRARADGWDVTFTSISRDDHKIARLRRTYPEVHFVPLDVRTDTDRLALAFRGHDTVIHAAASKHVDLAEYAVQETIDVNVNGSRNVAVAAMRAGVGRLVGISTDKACSPQNVYGMTKALMERLLQECNDERGTVMTSARYGNVIGSTGSVIPRMRDAIARGERVVLTDLGMTRFWMSHREATDAILHAALRARPGTVSITSPRAMTLEGLALCAFGTDTLPLDRVTVTGMRAGEKKHESLMNAAECQRAVSIDGIGSVRWEIDPVGDVRDKPRPQPLASDSPHAGWMEPATMQAIMSDAEAI